MTKDELKELPIGSKVEWVFGEGSGERRHPAKIVDKHSNQVHLLVYFTDKPQQKIRWSLMTDKPVRESKGYVGKVRIEFANTTSEVDQI